MKTKFQISYYLRLLLIPALYLFFFGFMIYSIIKTKSNGQRFFNIFILLLGCVACAYETLRVLYDIATKRLTIDSKPDVALKLVSFIEKYDFFKAFPTSCQMMRMLALTDLREFEEVKHYIAQLEKDGIEDYDVNITSRYCLMQAQGESGNRGKSNEAFKQLIRLRDQRNQKGKRQKGAYYFNWEVVNGQHKNYEGDYQGALRYLNDVDESKMNMRELMHYLLAKMTAAGKTGNSELFSQCRERLKNITANNKPMKDYIEEM